MHEKGTLRLCLHRTLTWPRPSADECSLDDLSSSAFGLATPVVLPHSMRHLLLRLSKNMLIAIKSAVFTCKQRSGSACSARGQITAFGLYCPLSGQAFAVTLAQTRFKVFDFIVVNAFLGIFHILFVLRHRFSLGHAPHALILLFKL